jgi:hypothetical protein
LTTFYLPDAERVVLVLSTGRTGTKALAHVVGGCYPEVCALHEPPPSRFLLRRASNRFLCEKLQHDQLVAMLYRCRSPLPTGPTQRVYFESNPNLVGFLDAFPDVFQHFQVLHVVRDPRTYIRSAINWGVFGGARGWLARYLPFWLPKPELIQPDVVASWRHMSDVERLAWHWQFINHHLDRGNALFPDRYRMVRFEDLFARDGSGLTDLVEWMGLTPSQGLATEGERVNASRPGQIPPWSEWSDQEKLTVLRHCAPLMRAYGYDLSAEAHLLEPEQTPVHASLAGSSGVA